MNSPACLRRLFSAIAALAFGSAALSVQSADERGRPLLQRFSAKEYRSNYQVWSATQAADGAMWFGSAACVLRYDGRTWTQVTVPTSFARQVLATADGKIYVGGEDEFGVVAASADGTWRFQSLAGDVPANLKPFGLARRVVSVGDAVYFGTDKAVFRWQGGKLTTWPFPAERRNIVETVGDELYVLRGSEGIRRLRGAEFEVWSQPAEMKKSQFAFMLPPPAGTDAVALLVLGVDGLFLLDAQGTARPWAHAASEALRVARIFAGSRLADGSYALSTVGGGVFILSGDGKTFRHYTTTDGVTDNSITGVCEDREGGVWLATQNGITRLDRTVRATVFDAANGLGDGTVTGIMRHTDGALYAAFNRQLVRLVPGEKPGTARWEPDPRGPTPLGIAGIARHSTGLLTISRKGVGLLRADGIEPVPVKCSEPISIVVSRTDPARIFVGYDLSTTSAVWRDGKWIDEGVIPKVEGEPFSIAEWGGFLWVATTTRGVFRISPGADGRWQTGEVKNFRESDGLPKGHGWLFVQSTEFGLHISSEKGLFRYDAATASFLADDRFAVDGRRGLCVESIEPVGRDEIWFAAAPDRVEAVYPLVRSRRQPDGTTRTEELPAAVRSLLGTSGAQLIVHEPGAEGGVVWVKGMDNLLRIEVNQPPAPRVAWRPLLLRFESEGRAQSLASGGPALELAYNRAPYVFRYAAGLFRTGAAVQFQTRLVGFRDEWSAFSAETETTFTNLEGGPFTFEVRGRDADGNLSEVARVTFSVTPPWHRRPLAYLAFALAVIGAVAGYVRWRLGAVRRERDRLERLVAERTVELSEAKTRADAASAAKSTFLAHMSHELRTPLNGIIGYAQILRRSAALTAEDRSRVDIVNSSGEHLLRMINEVLDFAKIEAGKLETRAAPFPLEQTLQEIANNLTLRAREKGLGFDVELRGVGPQLALGDAQKLRQVLENLLGNAVKFTASGRVTLIAESVGDRTTFTVTDTGVGISPADLARLFEPFQQARENRPNVPGTGLGLAISRRLVALMGGELQVDSAPGRGSRFWFTLALPRLDAVASQPTQLKVTGYVGPRRRLLVIDDVAINRQLLADLLTPLGFHVEQAATGREGLEAAYALRPDLVFLDLRLPDLHGLEVARLLRADPRTQHCAMLAMSASVLSFNRDEALAAGCDGFLPKPFREADLLQAMAAALGLAWEQKGSASPFTSAAPLDPTLAAALLELAETGDIAALREAVAAARQTSPDDFTLRQVESAASSYQLERVRQLLHSAR